MENQKTWKTSSGYIWSLIGSAVGFANILSFSAKVYKNGGGAFLIPYCLALFFLGIPMLILEGLIGKKAKSPLIQAYGKVLGSTGKTFGWLAVMACMAIGAFYVVLTGYSIAYTYFSAAGSIPEDTKGFFIQNFLNLSPSLEVFGSFSVRIFLCTAAVLVVSWFVLIRNIRDGVEKICTYFMPLLAFIMLAFAVTVCFLPGGMDGWAYYLKPNFSKLLDTSLWRDIFGQLFFSLSLGLGIVVGYSRYTDEKTDIKKAMMLVTLGDFAISFIAGFALFGCLAHISYTQNVPFETILTSDSTFEIGFVLFPKILQFFGPISQILGSIFFFCVFIAGITGVFSIIESIVGNIETEYRLSRKTAVTIAIGCLLFLSSIFCMSNGSHIIDALAPMLLGTNMLIGGISLVYAFHFRSKEIQNHEIWKRNGKWNFYGISIRYVSPFLLVFILLGSIWVEVTHFNTAVQVRWTYLLLTLLLSAYLARRIDRKEPKLALAD